MENITMIKMDGDGMIFFFFMMMVAFGLGATFMAWMMSKDEKTEEKDGNDEGNRHQQVAGGSGPEQNQI